MDQKKSTMSKPSDRELIFTRTFNAPRDLVFDVWTNPKHIVHWWGPSGFTNTIQEMEVKPGGVFRLIMHGPDGTDYPNKITYKEVIKPELLSWSHGSGDVEEEGDFEVTVTFADKDIKKTEITMRMVFRSAAELERVVKEYGAVEGNNQTMDRLEAYLAKM